MALDHLGFNVKDFKKSFEFYTKALAPLGIEVVSQGEQWTTLGENGKVEFWFGTMSEASTKVHVAFLAKTKEQVDQFYALAIALGAKDNGAPGKRAQYRPNYYAAFVYDFDGNNIEAVCHLPL